MPSVTIDGRTMHYQDLGEGFPLLLGHSFLWDSRMWGPQLELLSQHFRCIVPDLWSHGQSEPVSSGDLSIARLAEDHHALMQHLKLDRYSVVGMSVGAIWGAKMAMEYPDEVASLVMLDSYLGSETQEHAADYIELLSIVKQMGEVPAAVIDAISRIFFSMETQDRHPALVETFRFDLMFLAPEQVNGIVAMGEQIFRRESLMHRIQDIKCPTLIMVGDGDLARPVSESEEMYNSLPGSQFAVIENAGHMACIEQSSQVNHLLANFLSAIDGVELDLSELVLV